MQIGKINSGNTFLLNRTNFTQNHKNTFTDKSYDEQLNKSVALHMVGSTALAATIAFGINSSKKDTRQLSLTFYPEEQIEPEFDPETGKLLRETFFDVDGKISHICDYDSKTGKLLKKSIFPIDPEEDDCYYVVDYHPTSSKLTKITKYRIKDNHLARIYYFNPITGKRLEEISYESYSDSPKVSDITNYDPVTGKKLRFTAFQDDGIDWCNEFDPKTGKIIKSYNYSYIDKGLLDIELFDPDTEKEIASFNYDGRDKNIFFDKRLNSDNEINPNS